MISHKLTEAINNDLRQLDTWLQGNKLSLTVEKTYAMLVCTKQKHAALKSRNEDLKLKIRENELQVVEKAKYLGVQIDCSLDWKEQIKAVSAKVSRAVGFLKHAKSFLPRQSLKISTRVLWSPTFDTVALFGDVQVQLKLVNRKNFRIALQEL